MVSASDLLITPIVQILGRILLHFVWQGLAVTLVLWLLFFVFRTSQVRYVLACTALVVMTLLPVFTGIRVAREQARLEGNRYVLDTLANSTAPTFTNDKATLEEGVKVVTRPQPPQIEDIPVQSASQETNYLQVTISIDRYLPWLVVSWFVGVVALSIRLLGGLFVTQRLRAKHTRSVPSEIEMRLESLASQLKLKGVKMLESWNVQVPMVIGFLQPVVLLPTSAISGLSVKQLEMILAHELAHIRRNDYLVNILQTVIETLFFYHPAVWWVSNKIRETREHCCDDLAVALCGGNKFHYAQTLASLDGLRPGSNLAMAASGGSLVNRIERLAGRTPQTGGVMNWVVSLMLVLIPWLVLSSSYAQAKLPVEIEQNIDAFVNGRLESWNVPGIQVAVIQDGEVTFNKAYGLADVENNRAMTVDTPIPLGSGSWIVNALASMKLVDEGKLNLDDTIADYLPWVKFDKSQESSITIRELVANDANIPDAIHIAGAQRSATEMPDNLLSSIDSKEAYIQALIPDKLHSIDGANIGYDYSYVTNDILLSLILEGISGMPLEQFVQANIFTPLQIKPSYNTQLAQNSNIATTYRLAEGETIPVTEAPRTMEANTFNPPSFLKDVLGLSMSSSDLTKILVAVVNQDSRLLSPEGWNTFLNLEQGVWGAGGWWGREINNVNTIGNIGGTEGSEVFMDVLPDSKTAYLVMSNYLLKADTTPVYQVLGSVSMALMMFDDSSPFRSIPFKAEQLKDPGNFTIKQTIGDYASAIGAIKVYAEGNELKGNILDHEVVFKRALGLSGLVTQSDYAPLDGLILDIDSQGIEIWYRQFAYRVN